MSRWSLQLQGKRVTWLGHTLQSVCLRIAFECQFGVISGCLTKIASEAFVWCSHPLVRPRCCFNNVALRDCQLVGPDCDDGQLWGDEYLAHHEQKSIKFIIVCIDSEVAKHLC